MATTVFEIAGTSERINSFITEITKIVEIEVVRSGPIAISSLKRDEEDMMRVYYDRDADINLIKG